MGNEAGVNTLDQSCNSIAITSTGSDCGWYLYGVTRRSKPGERWELEESGLDGKPVQMLPNGNLVAIVSPMPVDELGIEALRTRIQNATSAPGWLEQIVRAHERVVEAVQRARGILPAKFGCVYATVEDLKTALEHDRDTLLARLKQLKGCDEWGVKLFADLLAIRRIASEENPMARQLRQELAIARPGRAYFLQRKLVEVLDAATDQHVDDLAQACYDHLARSVGTGQMTPPSKTPGTSMPEVEIMRAAFLVPRVGVDVFVKEIHRFAESRDGLRCEYSGPWPPYSFVALVGEAPL